MLRAIVTLATGDLEEYESWSEAFFGEKFTTHQQRLLSEAFEKVTTDLYRRAERLDPNKED